MEEAVVEQESPNNNDASCYCNAFDVTLRDAAGEGVKGGVESCVSPSSGRSDLIKRGSCTTWDIQASASTGCVHPDHSSINTAL